jgi:hypothetical protein
MFGCRDEEGGLLLSTPNFLSAGAVIEPMDFVGTNHPVGASYNWAFRTWLLGYMEEFADKKLKSTWAHLLNIMQIRDQVESWRARLPEDEVLKLNHPTVVWHRYQARTPSPRTLLRTGTYNKVSDYEAQIKELQDSLAEAKKEIKDLEWEVAGYQNRYGPLH